MNDPSDSAGREELRDKVIGLGERSLRKSHYAALQRSLRELEEKDRLIRESYSDIIAAMTGGRLIILGEDELDDAACGPSVQDFELRDASQLGEGRERLKSALGDLPIVDDLVLAFSEAATNMLKHAGGGTYRICGTKDRVQVFLCDRGSGIDFRNLPKATLMAGYSTAQTLGMGFTLMLELTDRLLLCTSAGGTTLVLEKDLSTAEKPPRRRLEPLGM